MTFDTSYQKTALFRGTPVRSAVIRHDRHLIRALPLPMANPISIGLRPKAMPYLIFWGSAPAMPSPVSSGVTLPGDALRLNSSILDIIPESSKAVPSRQDQVHPFALSLTNVPQYLSVIVLSFRRYAHCHKL